MNEAEHAMLDALFTLSPAGLHMLDTELRVVRINTATSAMQGGPVRAPAANSANTPAEFSRAPGNHVAPGIAASASTSS
ncbi:hypothetical protein ABIA33_002302 [Streptacidiphilus sp. MAP12-16]|uniref:hypothetical protein n=1 Tax=Streptacidiphilus sp. MAP12-16 TaxID=3156300 RepID=UPI003511E6C4